VEQVLQLIILGLKIYSVGYIKLSFTLKFK